MTRHGSLCSPHSKQSRMRSPSLPAHRVTIDFNMIIMEMGSLYGIKITLGMFYSSSFLSRVYT